MTDLLFQGCSHVNDASHNPAHSNNKSSSSIQMLCNHRKFQVRVAQEFKSPLAVTCAEQDDPRASASLSLNEALDN